MKYYSLLIIFISSILSQTGYDIAKNISERDIPIDTKAILKMTLIDQDNKAMNSEIKSYSMGNGNKQIMWFLSPPYERGIAVYKIEKSNGVNDMYMWLPSFKKERKISSRSKTKSFMNSDLSYEDLYSRKLEDFTYELVKSDSPNFYIIKSIPNKDIESGYGSHISWVDKEKFVIVKEESYDENRKLIKTKTMGYIEVDGFYIINTVEVLNAKNKHRTILEFNDIKINTGLKDSDFNRMNIRRIPLEK